MYMIYTNARTVQAATAELEVRVWGHINVAEQFTTTNDVEKDIL